jgi:hypothetical protein
MLGRRRAASTCRPSATTLTARSAKNSYGGTAASSAGQDVVNAKFDTGFPPTARKYEVVLVNA